MSDLEHGNGGLPENWGYPSPLYNFETNKYESGGMVWHGDEPATLADIYAIRATLGEDTDIDIISAAGGESFFERNGGKPPYKQEIILG